MAKKKSRDDIETVARKVRSPLSSLRMLSGEFRAEIAQALTQLDEVAQEREAMTTDRKRIQLLLQKSQETFESSESNLAELRRELGSEIANLRTLGDSIGDLHTRTLDLKPRLQKIEVDESSLRDREHELAAAQARNGELLERAEKAVSAVQTTESQIEELLGRVRGDLAATRETLDQVTAERDAMADKLVRIKSRTAQAELLEETLKRREAELQTLSAALDARATTLEGESSRVRAKEDEVAGRQGELLELQGRMTALFDRTLAQEEKLMGQHEHAQTRLEELDARAAELDARAEAQRQERQELDLKIGKLAKLDERNEELLLMRSVLDAERKEQDARAAENEARSARLIKLEEELSATLTRTESTARDTQVVNEEVRELREALAREHETRMSELQAREANLAAREKAISVWKLQAELRERKIQQSVDELGQIEARKDQVREQIAGLEREHAARIAATEEEFREERKALAAERKEAAQARDLYLRNKKQVDDYMQKLELEKANHMDRLELLQKREADLEERRKHVKNLESQVAALRDQQMELHRTIASLTTDLGARVSPTPDQASEAAKGS